MFAYHFRPPTCYALALVHATVENSCKKKNAIKIENKNTQQKAQQKEMVEENEQNFQCLELTDSSPSIHSVDVSTELYGDALTQQQYYAHEHRQQQQQQQMQSNRRGSSVSSGTSVSSNSAATSSLATNAMESTSAAPNESEP